MFTIALTRVPEDGNLREDGKELSLESLGLGEPFDPKGIRASWDLQRRQGRVYAVVQAEARLNLECGRCLKGFLQDLRVEVNAVFEPAPRSKGGARAGGPPSHDDDAPPDEDEGRVRFDGDALPLGEEIRQELETAVPFAPLCTAQCRGLCPECGADLNPGPCACRRSGAAGTGESPLV